VNAAAQLAAPSVVDLGHTTDGWSSPLWYHVFTGPAIWPAGSSLFRQDEMVPVVYALQEGTIKLTRGDADGQESLLELRHPPTLLGSPFVLSGVRSIYNAVTMTPCTLYWCSADAFQRALREDSGRVADVQRLHSLEIVSLAARLADMAVKSSEQRLVQFLTQHADDARAFRHFEIASFIRVTPEHLSRMLKKMAKAGTVRRTALAKAGTASAADRSSGRRRAVR
jgi:CRP/FNR family transcriptional regulator